VHALRNIHRMLVSGAVLIDLQPIPPSPSLHAGGELLGRLDQRQVWERFGKTEAGVDAAVGEGLYAFESELEFDVIERFDSKATLIATINERDDWQMTEELAGATREGRSPNRWPRQSTAAQIPRPLTRRYSRWVFGNPPRSLLPTGERAAECWGRCWGRWGIGGGVRALWRNARPDPAGYGRRGRPGGVSGAHLRLGLT
jgi:hypothetical protein